MLELALELFHALSRFDGRRTGHRSPNGRARYLDAGLAVGDRGHCLEWIRTTFTIIADAKQAVSHEIADIQIYLAAHSDRLGIDIGPAVAEKMKLNAEKYPAGLARRTALK